MNEKCISCDTKTEDTRVTLQVVGGELVTKYGDRVIDDCGGLLAELNWRLNEGYRIVSIDEGMYTLEVNPEQLCFVKYEDKEKGHIYCKVMDHVTAGMVRSCYGACLSEVESLIEGDDGLLNDYKIPGELFEIIDLRKKSQIEIDHYRMLEVATNIEILDSIYEDLSNY